MGVSVPLEWRVRGRVLSALPKVARRLRASQRRGVNASDSWVREEVFRADGSEGGGADDRRRHGSLPVVLAASAALIHLLGIG